MTGKTRDELLEILDNVSATADNLIALCCERMTQDEHRARARVIDEARAICDAELRADENTPPHACSAGPYEVCSQCGDGGDLLERCNQCGEPLEPSQIDLCDDCQDQEVDE